MPVPIRHLMIAVLLAATPHTASAGGPVQSLPKDGSWVKFFLEWELSGPGAVDGKGTGTWTVRSVGTKIVNGEKCRWIEIEEHLDKSDDEQAFTRWFKYLVREKDLKPGGDPIGNLVEYWYKNTLQTKTATKSDSRSAGIAMFFRGTPKTVKSVAKRRQVLWQRGEFTFQRAEEQTQTRERENDYRVTVRDLVWKKAEIPFGTAAVTSTARFTSKGKHSFTWVRKLTLADHGTRAKSRVPEAK